MDEAPYLLVHDVGTTNNKACLFRLGECLELVATALDEYPLYVVENGGVEQDPDEWWQAICRSTQAVLGRAKISPVQVHGLAFCAQMMGFIPVDRSGKALCRAMSYMDSRGVEQAKRYFYNGLIKFDGMNVPRLLNAIRITGGASASVKDPVWKYLWLRDNRPGCYREMYKWLDVKDYLVLRCTGEFTSGVDSAHVTFLFDTRPGKLEWHQGLCKTYEVNMDHLANIVQATDQVGALTRQAAAELGLHTGTPVFGGGGDLSMISLGSGCVENNSVHMYTGTSGWVVATVDKRMADFIGMVASIIGALPGKYNYISEQETSGRCLQWARDNLALDGIGLYSQGGGGLQADSPDLYDHLGQVVEEVEPGAGGVIFTPWMHGNRSPFEDANARGIFFNLSLETDKRHLLRAVLEGDAYHKRWMLETVEKRVPRADLVRFVGGGARSSAWSQILADISGREVEVVKNPENAGAIGAAVVCGVGLGWVEFDDIKRIIQVDKRYSPRRQYQERYERSYEVFQGLYRQNRKLFGLMNVAG